MNSAKTIMIEESNFVNQSASELKDILISGSTYSISRKDKSLDRYIWELNYQADEPGGKYDVPFYRQILYLLPIVVIHFDN